MDLQTLSNLFSTTFNPDPNIRKAAELEIRKIGNEEGMIKALLQIIATNDIDLATRQACSVWLKNRIHRNYSLDLTAPGNRSVAYAMIYDSDRVALRSHILQLVAVSPSRAITLQLANALKNVIASDYPDRWPTLLDEIKVLLATEEVNQVHAGCVAALEAVRAFRFRARNPHMATIVSTLFPQLVNIASRMVGNPFAAPEIPMMLHLILKTYKTSIIVDLSAHQQDKESLVPWGQLLFAVVGLRLPQEAVPAEEEEREKSEWWKAKKWACAILGRLFHRFGNPSQLPSSMQKDYGNFAQHFVTAFAPEILSTYLTQIQFYISGEVWMAKKVQYLMFQFFTECIKPKSTWALLKPSFESLVSSFVFPRLSFNAEKEILWKNDPVDYVRVSVDEYENWASPVSAATTFLLSLASNRTKITFMPILGCINKVLMSGSAAPQRFGALNMTAALGPWLMRHPEVKNDMEAFVMRFVTPEFKSPEPYLRAIACEVVGTVIKSGLSMSEVNLAENLKQVAAALDDLELPVRVNAALALTEMVVLHDNVRKAVGPQVGKVIQDLLKLSDETDLDILNRSMEVMVEAFQTELLPVAAQLTARLCESYLRLAKDTLSQEENEVQNMELEFVVADGDDDKTFAAMGVAKTISTVVSSVESSPEILVQVREIIIPIIQFTLDNKLLDLFDNMYDLVDSLTFKLHAISPNLWPVFELTYNLFKSEAIDFLEEMLPSLDNFLSYGSDVIKSRPDYKQMLIDIYTISIKNDQLGENDRVNGSKLAESILLNLRGHVDDYLQTIINTALSILDTANTRALRLANLEVLINTILYNPSLALHSMESHGPGIALNVFERWSAAIQGENQLPRVHDKKLSILALCSLLEMPAGSVPEPLSNIWPSIVGGVLRIFKDLPKAVEHREALMKGSQEEDDDEDDIDDKFLNLNDEEDDVWDEDSAYLELLANEGARLREKSERSERREIEGEEEEEESEDEDIEEELGYISPIESVNPYLSFKQALTIFQMQNPASYQAATTALDVEQQTLLMEVMRIAEAQGAASAVAGTQA